MGSWRDAWRDAWRTGQDWLGLAGDGLSRDRPSLAIPSQDWPVRAQTWGFSRVTYGGIPPRPGHILAYPGIGLGSQDQGVGGRDPGRDTVLAGCLADWLGMPCRYPAGMPSR